MKKGVFFSSSSASNFNPSVSKYLNISMSPLAAAKCKIVFFFPSQHEFRNSVRSFLAALSLDNFSKYFLISLSDRSETVKNSPSINFLVSS